MNKYQTANKRNQTIKSKSLFISTQLQSNRLTSRKPNTKKHCPDDVACLHCCTCWLNFQQEYNKRIKYFQEKVTDLTTQNDLLKKCLEKVTSESEKLKLKLKNNTDMQIIKSNLRKELQEQLNSEVKMKAFLQQEKITSLTEKLQLSQSLNERLQKQNQELMNKLFAKKDEVKKFTEEWLNNKAILQKEIEIKTQQIKEQNIKIINLNEQVESFKQRISLMDQVLKQKDTNIKSMKSTIDHSEHLIDHQMSKIAEKQSQKNQIEFEFATKSQQLFRMSKITEQHSKSISVLSKEKNKLFNLVDSLKDELMQTDKQNYMLKLALNDAQFIAREKSISLENLKYDVSQLKYTLI